MLPVEVLESRDAAGGEISKSKLTGRSLAKAVSKAKGEAAGEGLKRAQAQIGTGFTLFKMAKG